MSAAANAVYTTETAMSKVVTAEVAAKAMGGFSWPDQCSNAVYAAQPGPEHDPRAARCVGETANARRFEAENGPLFWYPGNSFGSRYIETDPGSFEFWVSDWGSDNPGWTGYAPDQVQSAIYRSATSGSGMRYTRIGVTPAGVTYGSLEYLRGSDPAYRGQYYAEWEKAQVFTP